MIATRFRLGLAALLIAVAGGAPLVAQPDPNAPLPLNPAVVTGQLKNGLRYYIMRNARPENRAELRLVVDAGSVLERDDQQGLAHFVEHMAFNGTKNFQKHELVGFLESIGMRFGADLNAYTSFDETVYMLQLPTDSLRLLDKGIQILEDWAHNVLMEGEEIDKERGVITEEWRMRRNVSTRLSEKNRPVVFYNTQYGQRLPIGLPAVLDTFHHQVLRDFYNDWYRPDLMSVIAVGDFDPKAVEQMIQDHFNRIPKRQNPPMRTRFEFPAPDTTLVAIATDPEAPGSEAAIYYKHPYQPSSTASEYAMALVRQLVGQMFGARLDEVARKPDAPFLAASTGGWQFSTAISMYVLQAQTRDGEILTGLRGIATEAERVRQHGFTQSELDRARLEMLSFIEKAYNEREKTESAAFARELVGYALGREVAPGIEIEYRIYSSFLPQVNLEMVNGVAREMLETNSIAVTVESPEKQGIAVPTEAQIRSTLREARQGNVTAWVDNSAGKSLMATKPTPGKIVSERKLPEIGVTEWTLSNGAKVVLKPTSFKNDEILFSAQSPGGTSLAPDSLYIAADAAATVVAEGGVGEYSQIELGKLLAGRIVGVSPYIQELEEGFNGNAAPKDLETLLQLVNLYMTQPRRDPDAYATYMSRMEAALQNRASQPEAAFIDTIRATLYQNHLRRRATTLATLEKYDLDKSLAFYRNRFADAGDFTFFLVGAFSPDTLRPLVETYLASLPSKGRKENWRDVGAMSPSGVIAKEVSKGVEPKAQVLYVVRRPFEYTRENRFTLNMLMDVLELRLRDELREETGGTYTVFAGAQGSQYPKPTYSVQITYVCKPDRVDELIAATERVIARLKKEGPTAEELQKIRETALRERETGLKENRFWLQSLQSRYFNGESPLTITGDDLLARKLTASDIQAAARKYLDMENYVRVVLLPENMQSH